MIFKKYKNDILLVLAVLLLAGCAWCIQLAVRKQGGEAQITVDGKEFAVLPLDQDTELTLSPEVFSFADEDSAFANTIVIRDGRVCVTKANCPDKICVNQGWIEYGGESIVCLPHRLVVTVRGTAAKADAIAG